MPVYREPEHAEERDAQPEKVQRRLILRPTQSDHGADEQRKQPDAGQREVDSARPGRKAAHDDVRHLRVAARVANHDVGERIAVARRMQGVDDVAGPVDDSVADLQQRVAAAEPGTAARRLRNHRLCKNVGSVAAPEDTVVHLGPALLLLDVQAGEHDETDHHRELSGNARESALIHA